MLPLYHLVVRVTATEERDWKQQVLELWDTLDENKEFPLRPFVCRRCHGPLR